MNLFKSASLKSVAKMSIGSILGQLISIITLPIITRIYGVEIIGSWTIINSYACLMTNITDLGLTQSIMICNENEIKKHYTVISFVNMFMSLLAGMGVYVYFTVLQNNNATIPYIVFFIVLYSLELVQINILNMVLNREKKYSALMFNTIFRFGSLAIVAILLGYMNFKETGYIIANVVSQAITILFLLFNTKSLMIKVSWHDFVHVIKSNISFVKFQMPNAITVTLRTELPNILIGNLFSNEILGCFAISQKLLTIPITFLGQSIGKVFYQKISEKKRREEKIGSFVVKSINRGMIIAVLPMMLFAAIGDMLIVVYFGKEYMIGGILCRLIAFRSVFNFISTSVQGLDIIVDKQHYIFITCISQTILSGVAILIGYYCFNSIYISVLLMVIGFILVQVIYFCKIYKVLGLNWLIYVRNIFGLVAAMLIGMIMLRRMVITVLLYVNIPITNKILECFVNTPI